jgi:hypothetical protein
VPVANACMALSTSSLNAFSFPCDIFDDFRMGSGSILHERVMNQCMASQHARQFNTVLWTILFSYGNMRFFDPRHTVTPRSIFMKFCTIDNVGEVTRCAKNDNNRFSGVCSTYA